MVAHVGVVEQADLLEVVFHDAAQFGHQAGHVHAAGLEVAALGVEHGLHLFHDEGDVAALAEHGGHDAGQRHDPLEVLHRLGVDEHLERAARFVLGAGVEHDVVDGHVHGVFHQRRLDLVGGADQHFRALDALVHLDHVGHGLGGDFGLDRGARHAFGLDGGSGFARLVLGGDDGVALDFLVDLDGHCGADPGAG